MKFPVSSVRSPLAVLFAMLTIVVTVVSCTTKKVYEGDCEYNSDCEAGQVCREATCQTVDCIEATDCSFGQYCTEMNACESGCKDNNDCLAGETCNVETNVCEAYGCRETQLDCGYGEYCDVTTGTCYEASEQTCDTCSRDQECGTGGGCIPTIFTGEACDAADANACGGDPSNGCWIMEMGDSCNPLRGDADCEAGWYCDLFDTFSAYCHRDECITSTCTVTCDVNSGSTDECPRGFGCSDYLGTGQGYCAGDCGWMLEKGHL